MNTALTGEEQLSLAGLLSLLSSQLASVILKQYVETHWCAQSEKFRPPETTERVRRPLEWPTRGGPRAVLGDWAVGTLCGQSALKRPGGKGDGWAGRLAFPAEGWRSEPVSGCLSARK